MRSLRDTQQLIENMTRHVASSLGSLYSRDPSAPAPAHLIFPQKRQGEVRVSEQESKILFCGWLNNSRLLHSVETPTLETYCQQPQRPEGNKALSARTDLTLWDTFNGELQPWVNIELKAHNCELESIRKDLEKLLRENVDGIWFHTLEKANSTTFRSLFSKFAAAFHKVKTHYATSNRDYLFAFCVLNPNFLVSRMISFNGNPDHNGHEIESAFGDLVRPRLTGWRSLNLSTGKEDPGLFARTGSLRGPHQPRKVGGGARKGFMIFAPEINPKPFLHLSTRGSSFRVRDYSQTGPESRPKQVPLDGNPTLGEFRRTVRMTIELTPEDMKMNIDDRPDYWFRRIAPLNHDLLKGEQASKTAADGSGDAEP